MPSYSWWQAIQVLAGREPGTGDVPGITEGPPYLELEPEAVLALLADGCAVVLGVPFDGQVHAPIPADAWRRIRIQLRSDPPFAVGEEPFGVVAVLRAGQGGGKSAGGGWHHLVVTGPELAKLKATAERLTGSRTSPEVGEPQGTAADGPAVTLPDAAAQIGAVNPAEGAPELLARLARTAELGNLRTAPAPGAEPPLVATLMDLAAWCRRRALACPDEWGSAPADEDGPVPPAERDPDPWITPLEAAEWLAYRARDATDDLEAAVTGKLLPALRAGRLTAAGREGGAGEHQEIPPVRWARAELDVLAAEGGMLWLGHERRTRRRLGRPRRPSSIACGTRSRSPGIKPGFSRWIGVRPAPSTNSSGRSRSYARSGSRVLADATGERENRRFRQRFRGLRTCRPDPNGESGPKHAPQLTKTAEGAEPRGDSRVQLGSIGLPLPYSFMPSSRRFLYSRSAMGGQPW
jgi:hypothetical protein